MKNRILIVEDEEAIAKMISMNLKVSNYDTKISVSYTHLRGKK